jgi:hypothetical protein
VIKQKKIKKKKEKKKRRARRSVGICYYIILREGVESRSEEGKKEGR